MNSLHPEPPKERFTFYTLLILVIGVHLLVLLTMSITTGAKEEREDASIFKIVDIDESVPSPPPPPPPSPEKPKEETIEVSPQDAAAELVLETDKEVVEKPLPPSPQHVPEEPEYLPQHKISVAPKIPSDELCRNIVYPPLANRQRIEGVVYLELFIDSEGRIRKIDVLKDPGYGLAEAAVAAFQGIRCFPAESNGKPVAVRYRYPIRFQLR